MGQYDWIFYLGGSLVFVAIFANLVLKSIARRRGTTVFGVMTNRQIQPPLPVNQQQYNPNAQNSNPIDNLRGRGIFSQAANQLAYFSEQQRIRNLDQNENTGTWGSHPNEVNPPQLATFLGFGGFFQRREDERQAQVAAREARRNQSYANQPPPGGGNFMDYNQQGGAVSREEMERRNREEEIRLLRTYQEPVQRMGNPPPQQAQQGPGQYALPTYEQVTGYRGQGSA